MLPKGWVETKLEDFCDVTAGQSPAGHLINKIEEGLPFFQGKGEFGTDYPSAKNWCLHPPKQAERNDILISVRAPVGPTNYAPEACGIGRGLASVTPLQNIPSAFVRNALHVMEPELKSKATGSTFEAITTKVLKNSKVYLPPLAEQRRIVAKLDSLTARIARARAELERGLNLAQKMRKAVLACAFSGTLSGITAKITNKLDNPPHWNIIPLGKLGEIQGGIQVGKKRAPGIVLLDTPYIRVANVQKGWLNLGEIKTLMATEGEIKRLTLQDGDILMNEGGDRDKLGRGWVWKGQIPNCIHQNHVFRVRLADRTFPPEFVSYYANEFGQAYFIDQGTQTTNLASISKSKIAALPVPVPPADEAWQIVRIIKTTFIHADHLATEAQRTLALLNRLESSLLAKAFRGELVPQDPNDEPASALLDRIRAERAAGPKPKRGRKT